MKKFVSILLTIALITPTAQSFAATPKAGAACKKLNEVQIVKNVKFTCIKSGKKLIWDFTIEKTKPVTFVPSPAPTSFDDLYEKRAGISYAAWFKTTQIMKNSTAREAELEIYTGPNTKPWQNDVAAVQRMTTRAFPNMAIPSKVIYFRYSFEDMKWADDLIKTKISEKDYNWFQGNEGNRLVESNCGHIPNDCDGAKELTTLGGVAVILQGVPKNPGRFEDPVLTEHVTTGMAEAHEYFHSFQRIPMLNKSLEANDWPPPWIREGGAQWVGTVVAYPNEYEKFLKYRNTICNQECRVYSDPKEALTYITKTDSWSNGWQDYSFGFRLIEILVAIKGPESIIELYNQSSTKIGWAAAFKNVYGIEWSKAAPIIAQTVSAILKEENA